MSSMKWAEAAVVACVARPVASANLELGERAAECRELQAAAVHPSVCPSFRRPSTHTTDLSSGAMDAWTRLSCAQDARSILTPDRVIHSTTSVPSAGIRSVAQSFD